jgi:hypothetical protein
MIYIVLLFECGFLLGLKEVMMVIRDRKRSPESMLRQGDVSCSWHIVMYVFRSR